MHDNLNLGNLNIEQNESLLTVVRRQSRGGSMDIFGCGLSRYKEQKSGEFPGDRDPEQQSENNSSFTQQIEKNHVKLKNMIYLIDNRPTTKMSDILSINSTKRAQKTNRLNTVHDDGRTTRLKKKGRVRKDLQQVKENLKKVINLIDHKLENNDQSVENEEERQELMDIKRIVGRSEANLTPQPVIQQKLIKQEDILRIPCPSSHPLEQKTYKHERQPHRNEELQKDPSRCLNLKQSFDNINRGISSNRLIRTSAIANSTSMDQISPRGKPINPLLQQTPVDKLNQMMRPLSQPHHNPIQHSLFRQNTFRNNNPQHLQHIVKTVRKMSPQPLRAASVSPRVKFNYNQPEQHFQYPNKSYKITPTTQHSPPQPIVYPQIAPKMIVLKESEQFDSCSSALGDTPKKSNWNMKKQFSFKKNSPPKEVPQRRFVEEYQFSQSQDIIKFPDPFIGQDMTIQSPFKNWRDHDPQYQNEPRFSKLSLKSIAEVSESSRNSMMRRRQLQEYASNNSRMKGSTGIKKKKGIKMTYPTYQTQYFPKY